MTGHHETAAPRPGPLVEPTEELTGEQAERASRQMLLPGFGEVAQRRLRAARVLVIGAGGLGSACVPYLAGAGVGTIGIVDDDAVELSNLHRQVAHGTADIGRRKAESLADSARAIDSGLQVVEHDLRLTSANALELFGGYDLVIDGSDNFPTRYLANDAAQLAGVPLIWGAILGYHGQLGVAWHAYGPGYRDLFPAPPDPDGVVTCASGGVLPGLCGTIGSLLATEAMKLIAGIGEPLIGRVLVYDALRAETRDLTFARDPQAEPVTGLVDYELFCAGSEAPQALTPEELVRRLDSGDVRLFDVRNAEEWEGARIEPSTLFPLSLIEAGEWPKGFASDAGIAVTCAQGPRSIRAVKLLREHGIDAAYLNGGVEAVARLMPERIERGARKVRRVDDD